jgi:ketosteroid isomerase-like protein
MKHFIAVLPLALAWTVSAQEPALSAEECTVWAREQSFAESVDHHDAKSFAEHVHPGAVFGAASANVQRGRDAIVTAWQPIIDGREVTLRWRPHFVSIGADPNVAISRGPFVISSKDAKGSPTYKVGDFVSVWVRKDAKSPWVVLFDGGGPPPATVGEDEANKHLQSAPPQCRQR